MNKARHFLAISAGICALSVSAAYAQEAEGASARDAASPSRSAEAMSPGSDDIIVQARRRDERLQEVPVSVAALTPQLLLQNNITNVNDLSKIAPSLTITPGQASGRSTPSVAIRGLSQQEQTLLADPSVPFYMGDIVAARSQGVAATLFDIGSVEVLRGPQGTLFGRNSTGGAIVIRPNRPTDRFEGYVSFTYGRFDSRKAEAMVNLPLSDNIIVRLAGATNQDDGFFFDEALGQKIDDTDQKSARASVLLHNDSGLESLTVYNYFHDDSGTTPTFIYKAIPTSSFNSPASQAARQYRPIEDLLVEQQARGIYRGSSGQLQFTRMETHDIANTTTVPLTDQINIKNIIGYRHIDDHLLGDSDGTENSILPIYRIDYTNQFTEEFQVLGDMGQLNWIAGLYYFWERGRNQGISNTGATDPGLVEPGYPELYPNPVYSNTDVAARNISYAAFVQGDYALTDQLKLTAGIRFNTDKRRTIVRNRTNLGCRFSLDLDNDPATPETVPPLSECIFTADKKFSEPTYNLGISYQANRDLLVYAAHRHGYRTGGFAARAATQAGLERTFQPETVDDIEVGVKADWRFGNAFLRTNVAAYYADYKNLQRVLSDNTTIPVTTVAVNAGKARIKGVEVDVLFRPIPQIELTANYAYTDAKYKAFIYPDGSDHTSDPFARAPKNVFTLGARYTHGLNDNGELSIGGSYFHTDSYNGNESYERGFTEVEGYHLVNADVSWNRVLGSGIDLSAFVTNLTKERYSLLYMPATSLGYVSHTPGAPRIWGLRARVSFGETGR